MAWIHLLDQKQDVTLVNESSMVNLDVSFDCRFPLIIAESVLLISFVETCFVRPLKKTAKDR